MLTIYPNPNIALSGLFNHVKLSMACILMLSTYLAQAACVDNMDTTYACDHNAAFVDANIAGTFTIDTSPGPATFTNTTTEAAYSSTGANSTLSGSVSNQGAGSLISVIGSDQATINNVGGFLLFSRSTSFDPSAWSNDASGILYNSGVRAGYAAAIEAGSATSSLTVNNATTNTSTYYPITGSSGITGLLYSFGEYTAAIHTSTPQLTVNNMGSIGSIVSYGSGTTTLNYGVAGGNIGASFGDIYIVDRNPLLAAAQAQDPSLVLAYSADQVGPRNSVINLRGYSGSPTQVGSGSSLAGALYLGSGAHLINNIGGVLTADIFVDQRDADIVDVAGGVATTIGSVHGARTFTLNSVQDGYIDPKIGNITINDVVGSVNTINHTFTNSLESNFTANGLGTNTINLNCVTTNIGAVSQCDIRGATTGFTNLNLDGKIFEIFNNQTVTNDININAQGLIFGPITTLTANNVVVGINSFLGTRGDQIGNINGNLINRGALLLEDTTLDVNGNVDMQAGSKLYFTISAPDKNGNLNTSGTTTFSDQSLIVPRVVRTDANQGIYREVRIIDGTSFTIATNATGIPLIQNDTGFLQWTGNTATGDLVLIADVGTPDFMKSQLTKSAQQAVDAAFSYTGSNGVAASFQTELLTLNGISAIRAAERLRPETNDGSFRAVQMGTDKLFNFLDGRLQRSDADADEQTKSPQNIAAKDGNLVSDPSGRVPQMGKGVWTQGFGDRAQQQGIDGFDGYSISAAGFGMGLDGEFMLSDVPTRLGLAMGYNRSNVTNTGNTVNNRIDINSFMAAAYVSQDYDDWYLNGMVGVGRNTYESNRRFNTHKAVGRHASWQLSARVDAGWPIAINDNLRFIPTVAFDYTGLKESGYKENGSESTTRKELQNGLLMESIVNGLPVAVTQASPLNLEYQDRNFNSFRSGIGGKAVYSLQETNWGAEFELRGLYRHEFGDLAQDNVARFIYGGDQFKSPGQKPARDSAVFGGSLRMMSDIDQDQISLITSYDAEFREKYMSQTMSLAVRYDFDQAASYRSQARARLVAMQNMQPASNGRLQTARITSQDISDIQKAISSNNLMISSDPAQAADQIAINETIQKWLNALTNKNTDVYFNTYAADFESPEGISRQKWQLRRKAEIIKAANTAVKISNMTIESKQRHAMAVFTETPVGGVESVDAVRKIIDLEQKNGRWLIVREDTVDIQ